MKKTNTLHVVKLVKKSQPKKQGLAIKTVIKAETHITQRYDSRFDD